MMIINDLKYGERGEEFKVLYYASAAVICDRNLQQSAGNLWQIASTILSRRYSLPTVPFFSLYNILFFTRAIPLNLNGIYIIPLNLP
jgi:hypothetical protein